MKPRDRITLSCLVFLGLWAATLCAQDETSAAKIQAPLWQSGGVVRQDPGEPPVPLAPGAFEHPGQARLLEFSQDGSRLFVADGSDLALLDAKTGAAQLSRTFNESRRLSHKAQAVFAARTGSFATFDGKSRLEVFAASGELRAGFDLRSEGSPPHFNPQKIAFSADGKRAGFADSTVVEVFDVESQKSLLRVPRKAGAVQALAFSPEGDELVSSYARWRIGESSPHQVFTATETEKRKIQRLWVSSDTIYWAALTGGTVGAISRETGEKLWVKVTAANSRTFVGGISLALSSDQRELAVSRGERQVDLLDAKTGALLRSLDQGLPAVWSLARSPDSKIFALGGPRGEILLVDAVSGESRTKKLGHSGAAFLVRFLEDGSTLVSAGMDRKILFWDRATGALKRQVTLDKPLVDLAVGSSEGPWIANLAQELTLLDPKTLAPSRLLAQLPPASGRLRWIPGMDRVLFTPVQKILEVPMGMGVGRRTPQPIHVGLDIVGLAIDPKLRFLLFAASDQSLRVASWPKLRERVLQRGQQRVGSAALGFDAAGTRAMGFLKGQGLLLWTVPEFEPVPGFSFSTRKILTSLALGRDRWFAGLKGADCLWEGDYSGAIRARYGGPEGFVRDLALSEDEKLVAVSTQEGEVAIYRRGDP